MHTVFAYVVSLTLPHLHHINLLSPFIQYIGHIFIDKNIYKKRTLPVTEGVKAALILSKLYVIIARLL